MKYIKGFDTIRALAVFFVIVDDYHWGPVFPPHTFAAVIKSTLIPNGLFGVTLFFVLSGFLITSILLHEKMSAGDARPFTAIKKFFARRILRIFPIYYLTILVCCLLNYGFVKAYLPFFLTYTSNFLQYKTNGPNPLLHTWSLAVEEQFYIVWPWLVLFINKKYLKYVFVSLIAIGLASKYIELYVLHHNAYMVTSCFDSFGIGAIYAYARTDAATARRFERGFVMAFVLALFFAWRSNPIAGLPVFVVFAKFTQSLAGLALIMFALHNRSAWIKKHLLENRWLNYIGKISYGIYLYHFTLGQSYDRFAAGFAQAHPSLPAMLTGFWVSYAVKLALLLIICSLSYRFIERPILRQKKKFAYAK